VCAGSPKLFSVGKPTAQKLRSAPRIGCGAIHMCEYGLEGVSVHSLASLSKSLSYGFAMLENQSVAVHLRAATTLSFHKEGEHRCHTRWLSPRQRRLSATATPLQQINLCRSASRRDVLKFPDGAAVPRHRLCPGQTATVLQLPGQPAAVKVPPKKLPKIHAQPPSRCAFDGSMRNISQLHPWLGRLGDD
jgi:hypothetical protein